MTEKTFTVVGAGGFVGAHLVRYLRAQGNQVRTATRADWPTDGEALGHVIYAVGLTADFRSRPFETVEAHVSLVSRTLERSQFDSLLYLSSTRVYRGAVSTAEDAELTLSPTDPDKLYDLTKLTGEALCLSRPNAAVRVARLSNVFGEGDEPRNFLRSVVNEALARGQVTLRQDLASAKDYVAIEDVCAALAFIAQHGASRLYNVASGVNTRHAELAALLTEQLGATIDVAAGSLALADAPIDVSRLRSELGWAPKSVLEFLRAELPRRS